MPHKRLCDSNEIVRWPDILQKNNNNKNLYLLKNINLKNSKKYKLEKKDNNKIEKNVSKV